MNTADLFADTDPVDAVQRQLDAARVSSISLATNSTLVSARPSGSSGSDVTTSAFSCGTGSGQLSTTLSAQIRKLKNTATALWILGGGTIIRTSNYGSLINDDCTDNRHKLAHLRELYDKKLNVASSFDPASLSCSNCSNSPHQIIAVSGMGHSSPTCFILSDQNFPAALPTVGAECCVAIIPVEDATLADLASTFLMMTKGCDIGIGSVVVMSSLNHVGRVGSTAYAEDLVAALQLLRTTFGGQVRVLHGYPMPTVTITDQVTIRGLMEVESWLAMADQRRAHSLEHTSKFFMNNHLLTETETEAGSISRADIPLRLPASKYSKE